VSRSRFQADRSQVGLPAPESLLALFRVADDPCHGLLELTPKRMGHAILPQVVLKLVPKVPTASLEMRHASLQILATVMHHMRGTGALSAA